MIESIDCAASITAGIPITSSGLYAIPKCPVPTEINSSRSSPNGQFNP
jgi:hypothetical protein